MRSIPLVLMLMLAPLAAARAADLSPQDFAYAMAITTPAQAAAYRVAIPLEVYRNAAHEDLRDLRVFNARGEVVPYELEEPSREPAVRAPGPALPMFPLRADSRVTLDGVRVSIRSQGAAVNVRAGPQTYQPSVITSYVLDARSLQRPLQALLLRWPQGAPDFSGSLRIESSDDLTSWSVASGEAPVMNLHTSDAQLVQSRLDLTATRARFFRLTWLDTPAPFALSSVSADTEPEQPQAPRSSLTAPGAAGAKRDEFTFDLGARLPVNLINIELPEPNNVVGMQLLSRPRATDAWRPVVHGAFYRVGNTGAERHNISIPIEPDSDRFWLARLDRSGTMGAGLPKLQVTWNAEDVVFLARGSGPFTLAYGSSTAAAAGSELASLLGGVTVLRAQSGTARAVGGSARLLPAPAPPREFPWRMTVLWVVLGCAVLLLAYMAYRLLREMRQAAT